MRTACFTAALLLHQFFSNAQLSFKNDNVLYKTIDPFALCKTLEQSPGYVLLDVRSKGEYEDTSMYAYNYGRFKNAIHINVRELGQRIHELDAYKSKPVFVYCSHSQRSRRASKMLADSGFTNVNNINGGITSFHYLSVFENPCIRNLYETKNKFSYISPAGLCKILSSSLADFFLLDVRSDSAFRHTSKDDKENALGSLKGAVNIPLADLKNNFSKVPKNKTVVAMDIYSNDAVAAAALLADNGYQNVQVLIEGIDRWISMDEAEVSCKNSLYMPAVAYGFLEAPRFGQWMKKKKDFMLVDIRSADEFANRHKDAFRNIGHLKNAINIPAAEMDKRKEELDKYKNSEVVLYDFGGDEATFTAANVLVKNGFTKISILYDGIFAVRWTAGNVNGYAWMKDLVVDVPEDNK
jgi:rhodanese-related sulfurtransferase